MISQPYRLRRRGVSPIIATLMLVANSYEIHISPSLLIIMIVPIAISVIIILRFNRVHIP